VQQGTDLNQEMFVAGLLSGDRLLPTWDTKPAQIDFFDAKGHIESLFKLTACFESFKFVSEAHPALHPGQSARLYRDGDPIGWLGLLHPKVAKLLDLDQTMYLFEIKADSLLEGALPRFEAISKFPAIRRDLSIVVDQAVSADNVRETILKAAPGTLKEIELFDMYVGEGIDSGRKSLSLGLTLQDLSRTLIDSEIEEVMQRVIEQLRKDLGATLRQ
jgi:phenylalanyl-tRNA synthetase beta chain